MVAGTVQTIRFAVNRLLVPVVSALVWLHIVSPLPGLFRLSRPFPRLSLPRGGLRSFTAPRLQEDRVRFPPLFRTNGQHTDEVKWRCVRPCRTSGLYAAKQEQTLIRKWQPQPLFETPKCGERLTDGGRFHESRGTGAPRSPQTASNPSFSAARCGKDSTTEPAEYALE